MAIQEFVGSQGPPVRERVALYAWYALSVMFAISILNFVDRQILSILAEDIRHSLKISDADLGFLYGTAFAIFYALFGIPLGRLVDLWRRGRLMAIGLVAWSSMTMLSGLATGFPMLALARVGVGVGEASASPAAYSIIADYFPKRLLALPLSIYSAGLYVGSGLSIAFGAAISTKWDAAFATRSAPLHLAGWQAAFVIVGAPGLLLAVIVALLREPGRRDVRATESGASLWALFLAEIVAILPPLTLWSVARYPGALKINLALAAGIAVATAALIVLTKDAPQWLAYAVGLYGVLSWIQRLRAIDKPAFQLIFATRPMLLGMLGFGLIAYFQYSFIFWVPPYAMRALHAPKGLVGMDLGLPGALAAAVGVIVGGALSDWWRARDPRGRIYVSMLALVVPAPLLWLMFTTRNFTLYAALSPVVFLFSSLWLGSAIASFQDLVLPRMRGLVGAITVLANTMVGLALGPYITGKIATETGSLAIGVLSLLPIAPIGLLLLWLMAREFPLFEANKTERAAQAGEPAHALAPAAETAVRLAPRSIGGLDAGE